MVVTDAHGKKLKSGIGWDSLKSQIRMDILEPGAYPILIGKSNLAL